MEKSLLNNRKAITMGLKNLFHKKNQVTMENGKQVAKVNVANGYEPAIVEFKQGIPAKIIFNRSNNSSCLARVQSDELQFSTELPLNQNIEVSINTDQKGEFSYACGMNMFHGKVVIK